MLSNFGLKIGIGLPSGLKVFQKKMSQNRFGYLKSEYLHTDKCWMLVMKSNMQNKR